MSALYTKCTVIVQEYVKIMCSTDLNKDHIGRATIKKNNTHIGGDTSHNDVVSLMKRSNLVNRKDKSYDCHIAKWLD